MTSSDMCHGVSCVKLCQVELRFIVRPYVSVHRRQVLVKYLPGGFAGYDREGAPVRVETYGNLDVKGILYSVKKIDIEKTKMLLGEQVMKKLKAQSTKVSPDRGSFIGRC